MLAEAAAGAPEAARERMEELRELSLLMKDDPIVEEVRKVREAYAAKFNYDLEAIFQDLKRQERESGRTFVSFPPRRISKPSQPALP